MAAAGPQTRQRRCLRHHHVVTPDAAADTSVPPRTPCWCHLRPHRGAAADMVATSPQLLPQTWRQHHLRCCHKHGGGVTSASLSARPCQALLARGRPAQTTCIHLAPCSPPRRLEGLGGSPGPRPHRPWGLTPPVRG